MKTLLKCNKIELGASIEFKSGNVFDYDYFYRAPLILHSDYKKCKYVLTLYSCGHFKSMGLVCLVDHTRYLIKNIGNSKDLYGRAK